MGGNTESQFTVVQWTETRGQTGNASVFWYNTAHGLAECSFSEYSILEICTIDIR